MSYYLGMNSPLSIAPGFQPPPIPDPVVPPGVTGADATTDPGATTGDLNLKPPPGGEGGCAGGYLKTEDFAGGKGQGVQEWVDEFVPAGSGWMRSGDWTAHDVYHPQHGFQNIDDVHNFYKTGAALTQGNTSTCRKGFVTRIFNGQKWCCPEGGATQPGATQQGLGEFQWPAGQQGYFEQLLSRAGQLRDRPLGYTPQAISAIFGQNMDTLRGLTEPSRERIFSDLGSQGLLGTGAQTGAAQKAAWQTEGNIGSVLRDLLVRSEDKEFRDLLGLTGAEAGLYGPITSPVTTGETINAGRRSEYMQRFAMMTALLNSMMTSYAQ